MSHVITKRSRLSRRIFLKGLSLSHAPVLVGLPPLVSMFNSTGTAYAAETALPKTAPIEKRFVFWFNGNGIPERYWIPNRTGANYDVTPCLAPLARLHDEVLVVSGLDNSAVGGRRRGWPLRLHERADDVHAIYRARPRRSFV